MTMGNPGQSKHAGKASDRLACFSAPTRTWFTQELGDPTPVQSDTWEQIQQGKHALVIAPTGSGKTLAAFLHAIDTLLTTPSTTPGVKVLYISPLKALGADVERNLHIPLQGIKDLATQMGTPTHQVRVGVRSGDTPQAQRRAMVIHPPEILITTPESLFLMLSSQASKILTGLHTVIVDEVHYLAGTKRGVHLGVSLERLEELSDVGGFQRIGLSATVRPAQNVARFLVGPHREVSVVEPGTPKQFELDVRVVVDDMTQLPRRVEDSSHDDTQPDRAGSIWPFIEEEILELIVHSRSTICFCHSRAVAERLSRNLQQLYNTKNPDDSDTVIARTHHGSLSAAVREEVEEALKAGSLPCVVATSTLELGIDMGDVDLVIQVGSPSSVSSGLQRIGRGGHQVDAISRGVIFPLSQADLLTTAVVVEQMAAGDIEEITPITNPLDVLSQHLVSMCLDQPQKPEKLLDILHRTDSFAHLSRQVLDDCLNMLTGVYPSDDFVELRPRLTWDETTKMLSARPGARRLVTTSGGTIPDRGLYPVFMDTTGDTKTSGRATSTRVGELDEEMVYETRIGEVVTLGSSSWRITDITAHHVLVSPAPGQLGKMPFWKGDDSLSRSARLGQGVQQLVELLGETTDDRSVGERAKENSTQTQLTALNRRAQDNLRDYVHSQRQVTGVLPGGTTIVIERHRDEMGAWRICVHCPLGRDVTRPWAMVIRDRLRSAYGIARGEEIPVLATDDGLLIRLGEIEDPSFAHLLTCDVNDLETIVGRQTQHSSMFAAHFRHCAARALLLPRRDPHKRMPLWQQKLRSHHLHSVAVQYENFPIMVETLRECLFDVFDLPTLATLFTGILTRRVRLIEVETQTPSPFASSMLFGYIGDFMYDTDQPIAERMTAAHSVDPALVASLLGDSSGELLDPQAVERYEENQQFLSHRVTSLEALWDMVRILGPLTHQECSDRSGDESPQWIDELLATRRIIQVNRGPHSFLVVNQDRSILENLDDELSVKRLVKRWVRTHGVTHPHTLAQRYDLDNDLVRSVLESLVEAGELSRGHFVLAHEIHYATKEALASIRQRHIAGLRASIRPVSEATYGCFLNSWHEVDSPGCGVDALLGAVERLAGYRLPASMVESVILPSRVVDYTPAMLDHVLSTGEVTWMGQGRASSHDGWVSLWPGDVGHLLEVHPHDLSDDAGKILDHLSGGGAWSVEALGERVDSSGVVEALSELTWAGLVTCDNFNLVRTLVTPRLGPTTRVAPQPRTVIRLRPHPTRHHGRWMISPVFSGEPSQRLIQVAELELGRYGVLTKGSVLSETMSPSYPDMYTVLSAMETAGAVRRGYFITSLGPAQFALPGVVDRLRDTTTSPMVLLAACDPANPWGAGLSWPPSLGHQPTRKAGAMVVLTDGYPVIYLEKGAKSVVSFGDDLDQITRALTIVGQWIDQGRLGQITLTKINSSPSFDVRSWHAPLERAGFVMVPAGFRRRISSENLS